MLPAYDGHRGGRIYKYLGDNTTGIRYLHLLQHTSTLNLLQSFSIMSLGDKIMQMAALIGQGVTELKNAIGDNHAHIQFLIHQRGYSTSEAYLQSFLEDLQQIYQLMLDQNLSTGRALELLKENRTGY